MKSIFSDDYRELVKAIKIARQKNGLTQSQLSKKLGRSQSYISKIEQGQTRLDIIQLKELSKVLDINLNNFLD